MGLGKYTNQILTANKIGEPPWACIVITQKEYSGMLLRDVSTAHCVCAYVSGPHGSFYVVSVYCQYSIDIEQSLQELHNVLRKIGSRKVITGLDANAVSPLWCRNTEYVDDRGKLLETFISQWDLYTVRGSGNLCTYKVGS